MLINPLLFLTHFCLVCVCSGFFKVSCRCRRTSARTQRFPVSQWRAGRTRTFSWSSGHWSRRCWPRALAASQSSVSVCVCCIRRSAPVCVCVCLTLGARCQPLPAPPSFIQQPVACVQKTRTPSHTAGHRGPRENKALSTLSVPTSWSE